MCHYLRPLFLFFDVIFMLNFLAVSFNLFISFCKYFWTSHHFLITGADWPYEGLRDPSVGPYRLRARGPPCPPVSASAQKYEKRLKIWNESKWRCLYKFRSYWNRCINMGRCDHESQGARMNHGRISQYCVGLSSFYHVSKLQACRL